MSHLERMVEESGFDEEASKAGKETMSTFILTFFGCLFFLDDTAGLLGGALFFFVGIFAAPIFIATPLLYLKKRFPSGLIVFTLLDLAITAFVTIMTFSYFFTNPLDFAVPVNQESRDYSLKCDEAIPEFTLSGTVIPSEQQVKDVCGCIWSEYSPWAKEVSTLMANGQQDQVSELKLRTFIAHFGNTVESCNTENL